MATYAAWNGKLDYDAAIKDVKNSNNIEAARNVVKGFMNEARNLGVTDNDQRAVSKVLQSFGDKYGLSNDKDFKNLVNSWNPDSSSFKAANSTNSRQRVNTDYDTLQTIISSYTYGSDGKATSKVSTNKQYSTDDPLAPASTSSGGGGGGSIGGGNSPVIYNNYSSDDAWIKQQYNEIKEELARLREAGKPRVLTAEEVANIHDVDYNYDHILQEYNDATNDYYTRALDEYNQLRNNLVNQTAMANQRTVNDYAREWANAAPTATRRGELAANALSAYLNSNYALNNQDYNLLQAENAYRSDWEKELAANPETARLQHNKLGVALSNLSADYNRQDVQQRIDQIDAYTQMYAANRALTQAAAQGVANQYTGLAQAASTNAQSQAASYDSWNQWYNYYKNMYPAINASNPVTQGLLMSGGTSQRDANNS